MKLPSGALIYIFYNCCKSSHLISISVVLIGNGKFLLTLGILPPPAHDCSFSRKKVN